ncbi:MAG: stage II sporulation protein D [Clostridia bacterium]|nr:stage II sporulation protein D [Clostridia bacterium]
MKHFVIATVLLTLAAIFMPLLFSGTKAEVAVPTEDEPQPETSPQATTLTKDDETVLTVSSYGENFETTMAEYLPQVVAAEMPVSFEAEALKAQAVAARTYILYCAEHRKAAHPDADVCTDSSCCLAWLDETQLRANWGENYSENMEKINDAVTATSGQVMQYESEIILAAFHSSSAGMTETGAELWGDIPYLESVTSPETENDVPNYISTVTVTAENFRETVLAAQPDAVLSGDPSGWVTGTDTDDSGRVRTVTVGGQAVSGSDMRSGFSLRSTAFTIECTGDIFTFTVTGYGHGLGLSQYGANVLARKGFTYKEILEHYYPGAELV